MWLVIVAVAASLTACDKAEDDESEYPSQSKLEPIKGIPGHHTVTLTPLGAKQVGIQTTPVAGSNKLKELPYDALLYGADGTTFIYTSPKALTYRYAKITLEKIVGERIYFSEGPKVGTQVVTRGVPQVHGADIELEFGEIA
ncbi:MAG: hypothetical protein ABIR57_09420 [Aeromicrobium sp.]